MKILKQHQLILNQIKQAPAISIILIEHTKVIALTITTIPILLSHIRINLTKNKNTIKKIKMKNKKDLNNKKCNNRKEEKRGLDKLMNTIKDKRKENNNKCTGMKQCNKEK